jgi:dsDNA-specific endonuclease/ATPase MutS2
MRQQGARLTFATSHFAELKAMAQTDERFATSAVELDTVALKPTYQLLWGEVGGPPTWKEAVSIRRPGTDSTR